MRSLVRSALLIPFFVVLWPHLAWTETKYNLNAENRPIRDFLKEIAQITGKNFVIDPSVTGVVNFISPKPLTRDEAWEVAKSALALNGFTAVERGAVVKIIPANQAAHQAIPTIGSVELPAPTESMATEIIELRYITPEEAIDSVRILLSPEGKIAPSPGKPGVIVVDVEANVERIHKLIARFDVKSATQDVVVIPLQRAGAVQVAEVLTELFVKSGGLSGLGCPCKFTAETRSNSLVVRAPVTETHIARKLAKKLDGKDPTVSVEKLRSMDVETARDLLLDLAQP